MEHLAILSKERKLLAKILSGEKTIESRWYKSRKTPYRNISINDIIYFKESGEPVRAKARVSKVLFFDGLNEYKILKILEEYGERICVPISYAEKLSGKNFCTLVFIDKVQSVVPFNIDKTGYGLMAAWISVNDICSIISR
ncbi:MAG: ASCH domain-containing protein [Candidatus Woesearchaeota archaeon]